MSNYSMTEINNLIERCNDNNKEIIIDTLRNIIEEDNNLNIKLMNIEKINNVFFKKMKTEKMKTEKCENKFCTICQCKIKSKEHKIKLDTCGHIFHKKCLNKYLKTCLINFSCPNCKKDYNSYLNKLAIKIDNEITSNNMFV